MQNYKEEAKKQRQLIQALERERNRYGKDAAEAQQSCISQVSSLLWISMYVTHLIYYCPILTYMYFPDGRGKAKGNAALSTKEKNCREMKAS